MARLTLDIGGTKTRGYIYEGAEKTGFEILGGFGVSYDPDGICSPLCDALKKQFEGGRYALNAIAVNLGGKNKGQIARSVQAVFPNVNVAVYRESEGDVALEILKTHQADVLVMAGTGCIVFASAGEKSLVLGGWGKDIGYEGSGYFIGNLAIKRGLKELDGESGELSLLTKTIFGFEKPFDFGTIGEYPQARDLARARMPKTREDVAALTKPIAACAEQGCKTAQEILKENGKEIDRLIALAARRMGKQNVKAVINGGITNCKRFWEDMITSANEAVFINDGIDKALKNIAEKM